MSGLRNPLKGKIMKKSLGEKIPLSVTTAVPVTMAATLIVGVALAVAMASVAVVAVVAEPARGQNRGKKSGSGIRFLIKTTIPY